MSENILIATVGLPRSGKSTWARSYSQKHGIPIVNPDSVRLAIHGQAFILSAEQFVWATVNAMIRALFLAGHDKVILDATNINRKRRDTLKFNGCDTVFHVIDTEPGVCIQRAENDGIMIGVINKMLSEWEPLGEDEEKFVPLEHPEEEHDLSYVGSALESNRGNVVIGTRNGSFEVDRTIYCISENVLIVMCKKAE